MKVPQLVGDPIVVLTADGPNAHGKSVVEQRFQLPNGTETVHRRFVDGKRPAGIAFPLTEKGEVIVINEYKLGARRALRQLPCGSITGEVPVEGVLRELLTETGYAPRNRDAIVAMDAPILFEASHLENEFFGFFVPGCYRHQDPAPDPYEVLEVHLVPLREWILEVMTGKVEVASSCVVTMFALAQMNAEITIPSVR